MSHNIRLKSGKLKTAALSPRFARKSAMRILSKQKTKLPEFSYMFLSDFSMFHSNKISAYTVDNVFLKLANFSKKQSIAFSNHFNYG